MKTTATIALAVLVIARGATALDAASLEYPSATGVHKISVTDWFAAEGLQQLRVTCRRASAAGGVEHAVCDAWAKTHDGRRVEVNGIDVGQLWIVPATVLPNFAPLQRQISAVIEQLIEAAR